MPRETFCLRLDMSDPGDAAALRAAIAADRLPRDGLRAVLLKPPAAMAWPTTTPAPSRPAQSWPHSAPAPRQ